MSLPSFPIEEPQAPSARRARKGDRGLTVPELMVAVAIIAIVAGVAMPALHNILQAQRVNAAARQVAADVRRARALAVATQAYHGWHSGTDPAVNLASRYRIEKATTADGQNWPPATGGPTANALTIWINLSADYTGVGLTTVTDGAGASVGGAIFNSRGASVDPWTGNLRRVSIVLTGPSGTTRTVQVSTAGRVNVQ